MTAALTPAANRCPSWCADPGHPNDTLPADRQCMSDQPGDTVLTGDAQVGAYAARHPAGQVKVRVHVEPWDRAGAETPLSVTDARTYAAVILAACDLAEQAETGRR
jgi:hypothetical protein